MNEVNVTTNSLQAWVLAARPKTLTSAAVPVLLGIALAYGTTFTCQVIPAVLCMAFAFVMQIDANFVNDYFDFMRGNDDETRLGPKRACAQGWVTCGAMRIAIAATTAFACMCGLPLCFFGGWQMVVVGVSCVAFCFLYTTTFSYMGLGDVLVLIFFGLVPVCFTYYLVCPYPFDGFLPEVLLIVNNFRDIDNDRHAGKNTLVVLVGKEKSLYLYLLMGVTAVLLLFVVETVELYCCGSAHFSSPVLAVLYLLPHCRTWKKMKQIGEGRALNRILGETARNILPLGLPAAIGLVV